MSSSKPIMQPVRVSEILGLPKSSGKKPDSERKMIEPVRVKQLLEMESASKAGPSSIDRPSRRTFVIPKKTARRALYGALSPSSVSPSRKKTQSQSGGPSVPAVIQKPLNKQKRKSLLPPPNSIAQRYIQSSVSSKTTLRQSTIIEERLSEIEELPKNVKYQRPTVIKSAKAKHLDVQHDESMLNTIITIPQVVIDDEDIKSLNEDLEESIADKENIPPPSGTHHTQPLAENNARQFDNIDNLHLIGLYRSSITRMEKLEREMEDLKVEVKDCKSLLQTQNNLLQSIEMMMKMQINSSTKPVSVADVSSSPQILIEITPSEEEEARGNNKENSTTSNKKRQRKSKEAIKERRRSSRLAAKCTPDKNDSFQELENKLNIKHSASKTAPSSSRTPKNQNPRPKPKSERPLREYLAMKASMTFLETPDAHGFRRNVPMNDNTPSRSKTLRRSISSKLFDELQDLYDDDSSEQTPPGEDVA